jgi:redox-sensitive bicupin YhaK (pirin superfamily)
MLAGVLNKGLEISLSLREDRRAWVQIARGSVRVNGHRLDAGDSAAVRDEPTVTITASADTEALVFDLA